MTKQEVTMLANDIKDCKTIKDPSLTEDIVDKMRNVKLDEMDETFNQISTKLGDLTIKENGDAKSESDTKQVKDETVKVKSEHPQEEKPASRTPSEHTCQLTKLEDEQDEIKVKTEKEDEIVVKSEKEDDDDVKSRDNRIVKRGVPGVTTAYGNSDNHHIRAHQIKQHQQYVEVPPYQREPPPIFQPLTVTAMQADLFGIARANKQTPDFASLTDDQFTPILDSMQIPPDLQDQFQAGNIFNPDAQCVPPPPYKQPMKTSSKRQLDETPYMGIKGMKTDIYIKNMNCGGTITEAPNAESLDSMELEKLCKTFDVPVNGELDLNGRKASNYVVTTANTIVSTTNNVMNTDLVKQTVASGIYDYSEKSMYVNSPSGSSGYDTSPSPQSPFDDVQSPNGGQLTDTSDYGGSPQHMPYYPGVPGTQPQYRPDSVQPTQRQGYQFTTQNEYPAIKKHVTKPQNTYPGYSGIDNVYSDSEMFGNQMNYPVTTTPSRPASQGIREHLTHSQLLQPKENVQNEQNIQAGFEIAREIIRKIDGIDIATNSENVQDINKVICEDFSRGSENYLDRGCENYVDEMAALREKKLKAAKDTALLQQSQLEKMEKNKAAMMGQTLQHIGSQAQPNIIPVSTQGMTSLPQQQMQTLQVVPNQLVLGQPNNQMIGVLVPPNANYPNVGNYILAPAGLSRVSNDPTTCNGRYSRSIRPVPSPKNSLSSGPSSHESSGSSTGGLFYNSLIFPDTSSEVEKQAFWHRVVSEWPLEKLKDIDEDKDTCFHIIAGEEMRNPHLLQACLSRAQREDILKDYINKRNNQHETALYIAAVMNRPEMIQLLIQFSADPNITVQRSSQTGRDLYESKTALHYVASMGDDYKATLKALFSARKIDKNARDSHGYTPLQKAALSHGKIKYRENNQRYMIDSTEIIKELVISGADLGYPDGLSGKNAIHYIIETKCFDLVQATLAVFTGDSAELLNKRTNDGNTALHIAAGLLWDNVEMHLKLLRLLMNKGANPTAQNKQNQLPRQTVPLQHPGHQEIINVLTGKQKSRNC